jgi:hypothetical protein
MNVVPVQHTIPSSVGTFNTPNRFESETTGFLLLDLERHPEQRRPLLIVTGQSGPSRRFLRSVTRTMPDRARQCVVASGDTISFNNIYRDRMVTWPIQDLPFPLVFFCHHNPIDKAAGFDPAGGHATGTEDLLLFGDIVETLAVALTREGKVCANAAELAERMHALKTQDGRFGFEEGTLLFGPRTGNRRSSAGEHVVCLRPRLKGDQVLPEATIEVWTRRGDDQTGPPWSPIGKP